MELWQIVGDDFMPCNLQLSTKAGANGNETDFFIPKGVLYLGNASEHANMSDAKPVHSPIASGVDFGKKLKEPAGFVHLYQSHVGTHMWANVYCTTRPDLGFAVSTANPFFTSNPRAHGNCAKAVSIYENLYRGGFAGYPPLEG